MTIIITNAGFANTFLAHLAELELPAQHPFKIASSPDEVARAIRENIIGFLDLYPGVTVVDRAKALVKFVQRANAHPRVVRRMNDILAMGIRQSLSLTELASSLVEHLVESGRETFEVRQAFSAKGGHFLFQPIVAIHGHVPSIQTPEDVLEDTKAFVRTVDQFIINDVIPKRAGIEAKEREPMTSFGIQRGLLSQAGDLGILGAEVPEEFGGSNINTTVWTSIMEAIGKGVDSFTVGMTGHMGIGTHPIIKYGSPELKAAYLPKMASGERIGAYALTEPNAGSDAIGGMKTTATLSEDGTEWILNGEKCFITNAGFADVFTVFAKVNGKASAFVVDRNTNGFEIVGEEHKMGIRGSSTCTLRLNHVHIPAGHLLGQVGEGGKIALNILNTGRLRLGTITTGSALKVVRLAAAYAGSRRQFGHFIIDFGAVQKDLADMAIRTYVAQSITHRISGELEERLGSIDPKDENLQRERSKIIEEFSIEAAIAKIFGSEDYVFSTDRFVQIMGGYGYIEGRDGDESASSLYRDARINTLFEGTNGINRVHQIAGALLKRMQTGTIFKQDYSAIAIEDRLYRTDMLSSNHILADAVKQANRIQELAGYIYSLILNNSHILDLVTNIKDNPHAHGLGQHASLILAELALGSFAISSAVQRAIKIVENQGNEAVAITSAQIFAREELRRLVGLTVDLVDQLWENNAMELQRVKEKIQAFEYFPPLNVARLRQQIATHLVSSAT